MMLTPPKLRRAFFAVCPLLVLPFVTFAQFTNLPLSRTGDATGPGFSRALGEALAVTFDDTNDFDGSCGALDQGFGTYIAPRMLPAVHRPRIYFNPMRDSETSGPGTTRGGTRFVTPESFLLAVSPGDNFPGGNGERNRFVPDGFRGQGGVSLP